MTKDETMSIMQPQRRWGWAKIDEICSVKGRVGWRGYKKTDLRDEGPLVIGATHLTDKWKIDTKNPVFISYEKYKESPEIMVSTGDIIVAQRGSIGKLAIVDIDLGEATINPCVLLLKNIKISNRFLLYLLTSPFYQDYIQKGNTSTTTPMITQAFLKNVRIPIPPLPEQYRIVSRVEEFFSVLDAGVESLRKVKAQLKRYRQAVLKYAFEGKLTEEWRKTHKDQIEPAQKLLEHIKQQRKIIEGEREEQSFIDITDLPNLPEEWTYARLGDICDSVGTVNPKAEPENEFVYLEIGSIDNHQRITTPRKYLGKDAPSRARQLVKAGDILFSTVRTYLRHIALVDARYDCQVASTGFCVIRPLKPVNSNWVFYLVQTDSFLNPLTKIQRGTSYPAVRNSDVFSQIIPFAHWAEQQKIADEIEGCLSEADEAEKIVEQSLRSSERLRQSILKSAFEGKLVPQDPADEPAEKLLKRIKEERARQIAKEGADRKSANRETLKEVGLMRYVE